MSDDATHPLTHLVCSHTFHTSCLARWQERATTCPMCRQAILATTTWSPLKIADPTTTTPSSGRDDPPSLSPRPRHLLLTSSSSSSSSSSSAMRSATLLRRAQVLDLHVRFSTSRRPGITVACRAPSRAVKVLRVTTGDALETAGAQEGDILVQINGTRCVDDAQTIQLFELAADAQTDVVCTVYRRSGGRPWTAYLDTVLRRRSSWPTIMPSSTSSAAALQS